MLTLTVSTVQIDRVQWDLEYHQVAPRLQIRVAAEARDWRTHLEGAVEQLHRTFPKDKSSVTPSKEDLETIGAAWPQTKQHLQQISTEIAEQLTKIDTREQFLNNELAARTDEYRNKKHIHERKQVCGRGAVSLYPLCSLSLGDAPGVAQKTHHPCASRSLILSMWLESVYPRPCLATEGYVH